MAGLLYYIPEKNNIQSKQVDKLPDELQLVLNDCGWDYGHCEKGPEKAGALIAPHSEFGKQSICQYIAKDQTWSNAGKYWIGYNNNQPPQPIDLQRTKNIQGNPVKINNNDWLIPILHANFITIPQSFVYKDGRTLLEVAPEYQLLIDESSKWFDLIYANRESEEEIDVSILSVENTYQFCCDLLAVNYRIGKAEASLIKLVTTENYMDYVLNALGHPQIVQENERMKKKIAHTQAAS